MSVNSYLKSTLRTALALVALVANVAPASAATFTVNSTGDQADATPGDSACATSGGACTLRAAIQEANALAGADVIGFAIGAGVQTITVGSQLPDITSPLTIDGTTQAGYAGTPLIVVSGGGSARCLQITGGGTTLRGLALVRFAGNGLDIVGGGNNVLEANYVGLLANGNTAASNTGSGVKLLNSSNNRIGGATIAQRNVISSNTGKGNGGGIEIDGGSGNAIKGNFIGVDATGMLERANEGRGIALDGSTNNIIGGPEAGAGNLIAGNRATGVRILGASNGNLVQNNFMGVNKNASAYIANDRGVQIRGSHGNQIIGNLIMGHTYDGILIWQLSSDNTIRDNIVAFNGRGPVGDPNEAAFNGILVIEGVGNMLYSNIVFGNTDMDIDLGLPFLGPAPNDNGDGDTAGGNYMQNYPVLSSAVASGGKTVITGTLNSAANTPFLVQFFADAACNPLGYGGGKYVLGTAVAQTNATGNAPVSFTLNSQLPVGWVVTATATDPGRNTSEFSACAIVR
jgi:CSLREA domain-containing protein